MDTQFHYDLQFYASMLIFLSDSECPTPALRLSGGNDVFEGRVEICRNGLWGTVNSYLFDSRDATVVCRELGFLQAGLVTSKNCLISPLL